MRVFLEVEYYRPKCASDNILDNTENICRLFYNKLFTTELNGTYLFIEGIFLNICSISFKIWFF